jgi:hypothetical protein
MKHQSLLNVNKAYSECHYAECRKYIMLSVAAPIKHYEFGI